MQILVNGGLAGLFWSIVWTYFGFSFVVLSLAEMSSMLVLQAATIHPANGLGFPLPAGSITGSSSSHRKGVISS